MPPPTNVLFYRLLSRPLAYAVADVDRADALWNALIGILGFNRRVPQTLEESFIQVYDVNTAGTTRTLKKEVVDVSETATVVQDDAIGTLDLIEFQINTMIEQTNPNRGRITAIWNRLNADSNLFVPLTNSVFGHDTDISIHVCNHDFARFPDCVKFKEIINNTVTLDDPFP